MRKSKTRKKSKHPDLTPLRYGKVYCELDKVTISAGELVAWWEVPNGRGGTRSTAYCPSCHWANVRHGGPIQ
jgi:hypothetical protein